MCNPIDLSHTLFSIGIKSFGMIPIYIQFSLDFTILYVNVCFPYLGKTSCDFKICHNPSPDFFFIIFLFNSYAVKSGFFYMLVLTF